MSVKTARIFFIVFFLLAGCIWISDGLAFIFIGILTTCSALWINRKFTHFRVNSIRVKAKIIGHKNDGEGDLIGIVEFTTQSGDIIKKRTLDLGYGREKNSEIYLLYDPKRPSEFITERTHPTVLNKVMVVAMMLFCFIFGFLSLGGYLPGMR